MFKQASLDATTSKCMPPPLQHSHTCTYMTLTFDLWLSKACQQCPLTWWKFVPSFIEIPPVSKQTSCHAKEVLTDRRTDRRPENIMPLPPTVDGAGMQITVTRLYQRELTWYRWKLLQYTPSLFPLNTHSTTSQKWTTARHRISPRHSEQFDCICFLIRTICIKPQSQIVLIQKDTSKSL